MSKIFQINTIVDIRGKINIIEKILPFEIKRIFYISEADNSIRGGHMHKKTIQALICLNGSCEIYINNGKTKETILLNNSSKGLLIYPEDYHTMYNFSHGSILLCLASELYDPTDYINDEYND
jgi:dTDP-4-dehydrorhamnose 3,5-epimerase-like enzyme